jgi:hypothetical protein
LEYLPEQQTQHSEPAENQSNHSDSDVALDDGARWRCYFHLAEERVPSLGDDLPRRGVDDEQVCARVVALVAQRPGGDAEGVSGRGGGEVDEGDGHVDGDLEVLAVGDGDGGADLVDEGNHGARGQLAVGGGEVCGDGEGAEDATRVDGVHADPLQCEAFEEAGNQFSFSLRPAPLRRGSVERVHLRAVLVAHLQHLRRRRRRLGAPPRRHHSYSLLSWLTDLIDDGVGPEGAPGVDWMSWAVNFEVD